MADVLDKVVGCKAIKVDIAGVLATTEILVAKIVRVLKASNVSPSVISILRVSSNRFLRKCACDVQAQRLLSSQDGCDSAKKGDGYRSCHIESRQKHRRSHYSACNNVVA